MEADGKTYFIYDKASKNDHSYNNHLTKNISIETIFASDHPYEENKKAIYKYNETFCDTSSQKIINESDNIPVDLDMNLYNIYLFYFKISNVNIVITVVSVDNKKLEDFVKSKKQVPDDEWLKKVCRSNRFYNKYTKGIGFYDTSVLKDAIKIINVDKIITKSSLPNADVVDQMEQQPKFASQMMYPFQKRTVKWMLNRENEQISIYYNLNEEILIGNVIFDFIKQEFILSDNRKKLMFSGGALIDEVGLGKTFQMIVLSLLNPAKNINYIQNNQDRVFSKATLVICPNQLCGQWAREISKMINDKYDVKIVQLFTKRQHNKYTYQDVLDADFVIVSFNFLDNKSFTSTWINHVSKSGSYHKSKEYNHNDVNKVMNDISSKLKKNLTFLAQTDVNLFLIKWHRIIVDEFHEIFTNKQYSFIDRFLRLLNSTFRWIVTGTPFDKSSSCLINMIDYVTFYNNTVGYNILLNDTIVDHTLTKFFRRNTKKSVVSEYQLLPLKETVVWLEFSKTEWMMYNAYLANPNVDKFGELLRQICCHPKIADEIKVALSDCKTLEDIEKMMVTHYEEAASSSHYRVKYIEYRIRRVMQRIKVIEWKRERKFLRQLNYKVKICYKPQEEEVDELKKFQQIAITEGEDVNQDFMAEAFDDKESSDESDDEKEIFIISDDNQYEIMKLIGSKMNKDKPQAIANLEDIIQNYNVKLDAAKKDYHGKKSTYEYYYEVMKKLKTTTENVKIFENDDEGEQCSICLSSIIGAELGVTKCGHLFCYNCVKPFIEKQSKCPLCQKHIKLDDIYRIKQKIKEVISDKETIDKQNLINKVGTKLANLIFFIKKSGKHAIIFSQWDDLLKKVGDVLNDHGIKNVFCRGHVWQRDKAITEFNGDNDIKIIMLSSESSASGTNLTKAEMVILLDPVYGTYEYRRNTEWQAIGRAHRMGQTKEVEVVRFIVRNTVEDEIYQLNKKEDEKLNITNNISFIDKVLETKGDEINLDDETVNEIAESVKESALKKKEKPEKLKKKIIKKFIKVQEDDID